MSYGSSQGYYGGPPPTHSPRPGYGPPSQYNQAPTPFQGQPPYPQTQAHHGSPPPQGVYGLPPGPPPQHGGFPPQQHGAFSPQQAGYAAPPPAQFPPQQGGYGAPPPGQFPPPPQQGHGPPPAFPSLGYDPHAMAQGWDASADAAVLRKAMKGFGTDEAVLIGILSKRDPLQMASIRHSYSTTIRRNLEKDIASETSSYFREGLLALVRGPLMTDVHNVYEALKGIGTKESALDDVLVGRTNADMRAIKQMYLQEFKKPMEAAVQDDLSLKTADMYNTIMAAQRSDESAPIIPQEIEQQTTRLYEAASSRMGNYQRVVCDILLTRSDGQIRALNHVYQQKHREPIAKALEKEFGGHMRQALVLMVERACDKAMTDAVGLEETMKGAGTKDTMLVQRVVRVHWDRAHMDQVKRAYQHRYKRDLIGRIRGEVGGDVEKLLVACFL